ncbi:MAG: GIY-YIG nuclease family protein [Candidatus Aminicenantes bacterium]|nr:GIY-YIG nuclease family protein [Candidatus Aminicenantes bacterium]
MKRKKQANLVCQYLENISRTALERYQEIIKKYVRGRYGIYSLYRKNKLYYVGLASNLRSRLRHHLRDRHAETWDSFSVYLTIGDQHLKELESLILRITKPKGNLQKGKFNNADDLHRLFKNDISKAHSIEMEKMFCSGMSKKRKIIAENLITKEPKGRKRTLAPFINSRFHIRMRFRDKLYIAHVRRDGSIIFAAESAEAERLKSKIFNSPSLAAMAITDRAMNGWTCWTYERAPGDWVKLDELRK